MCKRVGHDTALAATLKAIVTDGAGSIKAFFYIAGFQRIALAI